jgi:pimeloyl-ACP methyl ester carboxylesterase
VSEWGPLCSLFAATHPEKTEALIMIGSYARRLRDEGYPWGPTRDERDRFCARLLEEWGGPVGIDERAPSRALDPDFRAWWAAYLRMGASPGAAVALTRMNAEVDVRDVLPKLGVPALVIHRTGDRCLKIEEGRYLASRIPGATMVELPGDDHLPFVGDQVALLAAIDQFLTRLRPG